MSCGSDAGPGWMLFSVAKYPLAFFVSEGEGVNGLQNCLLSVTSHVPMLCLVEPWVLSWMMWTLWTRHALWTRKHMGGKENHH